VYMTGSSLLSHPHFIPNGLALEVSQGVVQDRNARAAGAPSVSGEFVRACIGRVAEMLRNGELVRFQDAHGERRPSAKQAIRSVIGIDADKNKQGRIRNLKYRGHRECIATIATGDADHVDADRELAKQVCETASGLIHFVVTTAILPY